MAPLRVLQIVPAMDAGGMETFIMNVYRHLDTSLVQFDFLYHYDKPCFYDDEIKALGGHIYKLSVRQDNNLPRYCRQLDAFFADHPEYRVIHGHYSGFGLFYNHYAKKHGVPVRIGHSHNTHTEKSLTGLFDAALSSAFPRGLTDRLACGQEAGQALYKKRSFEVYPNGIEVNRFAYSEVAGRAVREEWGLPGKVVYGHVGRLTAQKNHAFLLDIFAALAARQPDAALLLVGDGILRGKMQDKANELGLADRVVFAGIRKDTPAYYSAMDVFLMPSLFEGLPVALVEAQASGLPCFVADTVSREAAIGEGVFFLPLGLGAEGWTREILAQPPRRYQNRQALEAAGYDVATTAARLQAFYLEKAAGTGV